MAVTGTIHVDLTTIPEGRHKGRLYAALTEAPDGARVVLVVGALGAVSCDGLRFARLHVDRLNFDVYGDPIPVRRWVEALRTGEIPGVLL